MHALWSDGVMTKVSRLDRSHGLSCCELAWGKVRKSSKNLLLNRELNGCSHVVNPNRRTTIRTTGSNGFDANSAHDYNQISITLLTKIKIVESIFYIAKASEC